MTKKVETLEQRLDAARTPEIIHVVFAPFPGVCDKYSLTVPETGERIEFDTEAAMLDWLTEREQQHILVSVVNGRLSRPKEKNGEGILLVPPSVTEEQWEAAARQSEQEKTCQASGECL